MGFRTHQKASPFRFKFSVLQSVFAIESSRNSTVKNIEIVINVIDLLAKIIKIQHGMFVKFVLVLCKCVGTAARK